MTNCVTQTQKNSKEYKALMDKFNLSSGEVEMLLHEYQNNPENDALIQAGEIFPSESYMQEHIYGPAFSVSNSESFQKLLDVWEKNFSTPIILNNRESAEQAANLAAKYFTADSVRVRETKDGRWQVLVTKPILQNGDSELIASMQRIVDSNVNNPYVAHTLKEVKRAWGRFADNQQRRGYFVQGTFDKKTGRYTVIKVSTSPNVTKNAKTVAKAKSNIQKQRYDVRQTKEKRISDQALRDQENVIYLDNLEDAQAITNAVQEESNEVFKQYGFVEGKTYNADDALKAYSNTSDYQTYKLLADMVFAKCKELGITFVVDPKMESHGRYTSDTKTVRISLLPEANTILHEAIHATTNYYLDKNNRKKATKEVQAAARELEECYKIIKNRFFESGEGVEEFGEFNYMHADTRGLENLREFVAELSYTPFRNRIKRFDTEENPGIWDRLINAIAELIGIKREYKNVETTAYRALRTLLENTDKSLFDVYTDEMVKLRTVQDLIENTSYKHPIISLDEEMTNKLENIEDFQSKGRTFTGDIGNMTEEERNNLTVGSFFVFNTTHGKAIAVVDEVLDTSDKLQFKYSLLTYHDIDDYQIVKTNSWIKLLPNQTNEVLAKREKIQKSIDQQFKESQDVLRTQLDAIYGIDSEFSAEEFRQIAQDIVYAISDIITEVEKNPEAILKYNPTADVDNVTGKSRKEILGQIGVDNVIEYLKLNNFNASVNPNIESFEDIDKAETIVDNIDAFLTRGAALFMQLEGFKITKNHTVSDEIDATVEDLDPNSVTDELEEIGGNEQENWGIDKRTEAAFDKASTLVKQALTQCYKLNPDGTPAISQWGIKQRLDAREATQSILKWTQGALSLSSMITKLEAQAKKNPWIQPIIDRLKDDSGKDTSFQSQFFGVMSRYFQLYSIGKKQGKSYSVFEVNTHPALTEAKRGISGMYNAGVHPLFDSNGRVNTTTLEQLKGLWEALKDKKYTSETTQELSETLSNVSALLGYPISAEAIEEVLDGKSFDKMTAKSLQFIVKSLEDNKDNSSWQPFSGNTADNGIINNIGKFISPITDRLEDTTNTSFYDSGNMYQSYVTPSYLTKLIQKFSNSTKEEYEKFIQYEYGKYAQFKDATGWRNSWLEILDTVEGARQLLTHKVQLNFDGNRFMINRGGAKAMSDAELTLSIISEYFKENSYNTAKELATAWFRIPLMSNKPSSEFIKFYSYRGANYKNRVLNGCMQLFGQELSRIQTVKKRNEQFDADAPERINNFDKRGLKFCFFDFLNDVDNERFHTLVDKVTSNRATESEVTELSTLARDLIREGIEKEWVVTRESWRNAGIIEAAKNIKGINEDSVESALENFFWNDFLASNNILNLTITDLAYYKNTEDVQKRLAQLHAPGIRANVEATDFEGHRVADSKTRTVYLKDVVVNPETLKSNIIENLKVVFNRKLKEIEGQPQYEATKALYESILEDFEKKVNVADAQGYASPTSYRKKAFLFGKWDTHSEEIYQKLIQGDYNFTDLQTAFQPLKPFVYTQIEKDSGVDGATLPTLKMGVQNKNSEYLLIMAGAIIQNEETGLPNYLRAIYDVMEESHRGEIINGKHIPRVDGIDTVQFESTVKAGLTGVIDLTQATSTEEAKQLLRDLIYEDEKTHLYDKTYAQELEFEDYAIQQEVPAHFRDHEQQQGSQIRMITVSDLNPNMTYTVEGKEKSAEEFRTEYEKTIAANIEESIEELKAEFHLYPESTPEEKNIALARVLQDEILSSPRYGLDLLMSCTLDEDGKFIIPLGDSTQSRRIEQLINSIVKNRINKQKIAGGPVVQVSNFGTSRQLSIRFKDKDGNILESLSEHLEKGGTEESWIAHIRENQGGVAYYEAFVPAYMQDMFRDFMDAQGNIDIEAIEQTAPELLQMIGYRIPSEDKYSMVPMKVVGFLPKEAGDGIMLPYEITLITGSDRSHIVVSTSII